ncbi:MAG TPA: histidine kinase dimerization/phospho-acceptor domain-containing protein, partial [Nocardioides sp.]
MAESSRRVDSAPSRLRYLADFYPDGILGATREGAVTILNAQGAALLGVDAGEALGLPLDDVLKLLDQDGHTWLEANRPFDSISIVKGVPEQSWLNTSGEEVLTTATLIRDDRTGRVAGIAVGLRSGRGRARLDRERSDLVATVAHELRSPLTGVKGFVQALLNRWDKLNDDQRKLMLTTVNADADRLARLIAELLDVARIDTGRLQLYPRESSAAVLVGRVVDSIEAGTARAIVLDVEDDLP